MLFRPSFFVSSVGNYCLLAWYGYVARVHWTLFYLVSYCPVSNYRYLAPPNLILTAPVHIHAIRIPINSSYPTYFAQMNCPEALAPAVAAAHLNVQLLCDEKCTQGVDWWKGGLRIPSFIFPWKNILCYVLQYGMCNVCFLCNVHVTCMYVCIYCLYYPVWRKSLWIWSTSTGKRQSSFLTILYFVQKSAIRIPRSLSSLCSLAWKNRISFNQCSKRFRLVE